MAFVAWQAFKRRSLALALVFVAFAFQWMPWARIDRATFQYHYYAAIPFLLIALAYFLAELRNGPSARTWTLARVAAAAAILGPALMWLFKGPLCTFVRVDRGQPGLGGLRRHRARPDRPDLALGRARRPSCSSPASLLVVQLLRLGSRPDADRRRRSPARAGSP